jgi:hypothetical protein
MISLPPPIRVPQLFNRFGPLGYEGKQAKCDYNQVVDTEYIKRDSHKNITINTEYISDFSNQALNDILAFHNREPEIINNNDKMHKGINRSKSFSPAPKDK